MRRAAGAASDATAVATEPKREVGVLAEGAGKALVEATDAGQLAASVGEVCGDPAGALQSSGAALPVRGPPVGWERHVHSGVAAGSPGRFSGVEVGSQVGVPPGLRHDVVVKEGHPFGACVSPADVAGAARSATS